MTFKIIETIERGRRLISTVPSSWESDGNLYWPRKNVISLKKIENSTPQSDWKCLPCILVRDNIFDYKTAEQEVVLMSDATATDTDNKENDHPRKNTSVALNLNNLATECIQASKVAEEASPMVAAEDASLFMVAKNASSKMATEISSSIMATEDASSVTVAKKNSSAILNSIMIVESDALIPTDVNNILIQDLSQENTSNPTVVSDIQDNMLQTDGNLLFPELDQQTDPQTTITESVQVPEQIGCFIEIVSAIQENQKILFENQQNMLKSLALLNTKLEEFFTRSQGPFPQERHEQSSRFKTITNIEELTVFEEELKDPIVEKKYFEELSIICSEKKTGHNNAYALVDTMFDRKFMTCCSWGGGTKGEPKHCFKAFSKTINFFLKVVHHYDKTFTKPICEDFFKNVMRHSAKRNIAKRVRNSTTKRKIKKTAAENKLQDKNRPEPSNVSDQTQ